MRARVPVAAGLVATVAAVTAAVLWRGDRARAPQVAGLVRQTEIRIAPEVNGRIAEIRVKAGQHVVAGDVLAIIDSPDLAAAVGEAEAAQASARADRDNVDAGVRAEEVAIAEEAIRTAEANLVLAQQQGARVQALAVQSYATRARLDEAAASLAKAQADLALKRAQWAAAKAGPTTEERALAEARMALSTATLARTQARLAQTILRAPVDGTVGTRVAEPGEVLLPGRTVMMLKADGGQWLSFTLREDDLRGTTIGSHLDLSRPGGGTVSAAVTELRPLGEFATWRAARAIGDHDLNSFHLRLDLDGAPAELREGMTVLMPARQF